jgi:MFS family permease
VAQRDSLFTPRFVGLWAFSFITFFSAFQLLPAIPFRILQLGGNKAEAGRFLAIYTLSSAFAAPLTGTIADHLGRRRTLIAASLLFIGFSVAYGLITNLPLLLLTAALHGAIWSGILSSSSAIMAELIPESRRTEGFAYWGMASTGAVAVAPAVGLWIFHYGWLTLCLELAAISAGMAIAATRLATRDTHRIEERPALKDAWDWGVIRPALSLSAISFGYGGITSYAAIVAVERHIEPHSIYFTVFAVTVILVRIFTSHLGDRLGPLRILYPSLLAVPLAFGLLAIATTLWQVVVSAILFGIGLGSAFPAFVSYILQRSDARHRARTFGSIIWAFDIGIGSGSFVIGMIAQHYSLKAGFEFAAVLACLSIPILMTATRNEQRAMSNEQ